MFENIKDIILIVLIIAVIYLLWKTSNSSNSSNSSENFDVTADIQTAINNTYRVNLDAMRNLGDIANKILNNDDTLVLPANLTKIVNLEVSGDLEISGNVNFTNKDTKIMEIFPRYMVIAWATDNIPSGWVLCDGNRYYKTTDANNNIIFPQIIAGNTAPEGAEIIETPDLRGRFVLGSGNGEIINNDGTKTPLTPRILKNRGGLEKVALTIEEIPSHSHDTVGPQNYTSLGPGNGYQPGGDFKVITQTGVTGGRLREITTRGALPIYDTMPHENMPPFYVLTYIMKL
jgi:microcystin-dependent protein